MIGSLSGCEMCYTGNLYQSAAYFGMDMEDIVPVRNRLS